MSKPYSRWIIAGSSLLLLPLHVCAQGKEGAKPASLTALAGLQDAFVKLADQLEPSVVTVLARRTVRPRQRLASPDTDSNPASPFGPRRSFRAEGAGTGLIVSSDGWIVTNDHVVGGADSVVVRFGDGREYPGTVRRDYRSDLALVKIEASGLPVAKLGDSAGVKVGQWAVAIGSPFRYEGSLSVGVVSSLGRMQIISGRGLDAGGRLYSNMIQTDAAINPGNSGGPLINLDGEVIGINTAIESDSGGSVGIGFAIPANTVKFVVDQLRKEGRVKWGYIGIDPETITPRLAPFYGVSSGALVRQQPAKDTPAHSAGILVEDVVVGIDGKMVRSEIDLRSIVGQTAPGTEVPIKLIRAGKPQTVKVTVGEAPTQTPPAAAAPGAGKVGIDVAELTNEDRQKVGGPAKQNGVLVKAIQEATAAGESELRTGDVILQVNQVTIKSAADFQKAVTGLKTADVLRVRYCGIRNGETIERVVFISAD